MAVITTPTKEYYSIFLRELDGGYYFRIIQNKSSGLVYYSYGKDYWEELDNSLICTPVMEGGLRLNVDTVKKLIEPYFEGLFLIAQAKIKIN